MRRYLLLLFLNMIVSGQVFSADSTFVKSVRDSLIKVAEEKYPFDPAYNLNRMAKFKILDTVILHTNLLQFDSLAVVTNPSNISYEYHLKPGREMLVYLLVKNTTVPYPVYYVYLEGDTRGNEYDVRGSESGGIEHKYRKAIDKFLKKYNKREITDDIYHKCMDSISKEYYLSKFQIEDKYHCSVTGYVSALDLIGKILPDTVAVLKRRKEFVQKNLEICIHTHEQLELSKEVCTLEPGEKYTMPDMTLEVYEFEPIGENITTYIPIKEFGVGMIITVLNKSGYGENCVYQVLVEYPDGSIAGTGNIRGYGMSSSFLSYPYNKEYKTTKKMAWMITKPLVKSELTGVVKSTALFPHFNSKMVDSLNDFIFVIESYFDAQDSFGVIKRTKFRYKIQYLGGDDGFFHNWNLIDFKIWQ